MGAMSTYHYYEPRDGHGLAHDPLNSIVAPRPIGWISSRSSAGIHNLAPYSFFNLFNYKPPIIGFASIGWKDSVDNIQRNRRVRLEPGHPITGRSHECVLGHRSGGAG